MHRRVALAIEARAGDRPSMDDARELAGQYRASASLPGAARGVGHAGRAAEHAEAAGAYDTAASLFEIALELLPDDGPERERLTARRAMALLRATRYDEGAELVLEVADELAGRDERRAAASLIADAAWASEMAGGSPSAFALAAAGTPLVDPNERDDVWARLTILDLRRRESIEPGRVGVPIDTPERREAARLLHADPRFRGSLAWAVWDTRADVLGARDGRHARPHVLGRVLPRRAPHVAAVRRRRRGARPRVGGGERLGGRGALRSRTRLPRRRRVDDGARRELARRIDLRGSFALQLLGAKDDLVHARDDGYEDLWGLAALLTSENTDRAQRWAEAVWFAAGARTLALEGRTDEARTFLDGACEALPSVPAWIVSSNRVVGDAAEAMWVLGDGTHLDAIAEAVRSKLVGPDFRCPLVDPRLALARVRGIAGDVDGARQAFDAARTVCDEDGLDTMRAMVDHDEGLLLARAGDTEGARTLAKVAAERFADLEMGGWLVRAEELAAR